MKLELVRRNYCTVRADNEFQNFYSDIEFVKNATDEKEFFLTFSRVVVHV